MLSYVPRSALLATLYDNYPYHPALRVSSGFSCLVRIGNSSVLLDTGSYAPTLLYNMRKLDIDPGEVTAIVISHMDSDHVGGLFDILPELESVPVYLPASCAGSFKERLASCGVQVIEVGGPLWICPGVLSTGELGPWIMEQSLIVTTVQGSSIIVGCGHPGIAEVVAHARGLGFEDIYLVAGGFDLGGASPEEIGTAGKKLLALGVKKVAPCHCSGDLARSILSEEFGPDFVENGVGRLIEV